MRKMNVSHVLIAISVCMAACQSPQGKNGADAQVDKNLISCEGIGEVKLSDTYADLEKRFGAKALSEHENTISGIYTSVWDGTSKQINVFWKEKNAPFTQIKYLEVSADDSPYHTKDGFQIGLNTEEIQKLNGLMPLTFNNFYENVDPGQIVSFNGGTIEKEQPCIGGHLDMINKKNIDINEIRDFQNEKTVETTNRLLYRMDVRLTSIRVNNR